MMRSAFTQYRDLVLPPNFDDEKALRLVGEHLYDADFHQQDEVIESFFAKVQI